MLRVLDCLWDPGFHTAGRGKGHAHICLEEDQCGYNVENGGEVRLERQGRKFLKWNQVRKRVALDTAAAAGRGSATLGHWLGVDSGDRTSQPLPHCQGQRFQEAKSGRVVGGDYN